MSTPDEHRSRRAIIALSHGKPRPYRRQIVSDEPFRLSRLQVVLLSAGAIVIAGLILTVTVIAQEHANATRGKAIIAAQASFDQPLSHAPVEENGSGGAHPAAPVQPTPPVLDDSSLPFPLPLTPPQPGPQLEPRLVMPARLSMPRPVAAPALRRPRPAPHSVVRQARPAPTDPAVDLIATILQLTPPPPVLDRHSAVCTPAEVLENLCGEHHGMRP